MATPTVLTDATIWLGGYDLSGASNEITFDAGRKELPDNRFGDTLEAFYPGPLEAMAEAKGFFDSTLDDPLFGQAIAPTAAWPLSISPDGGDAGEAAHGIRAYTFNYSARSGRWGESLPYRLLGKGQSGTGLDRHTIMLPKVTRTVSETGAKYELGALSATQKLVAFLHVFAITAGSWAFGIESDADAAAGGEISRGSFTAVTTAPGFQVVEVSGPVTDTFWRVDMVKTGGTDLTAAVLFAIADA